MRADKRLEIVEEGLNVLIEQGEAASAQRNMLISLYKSQREEVRKYQRWALILAVTSVVLGLISVVLGLTDIEDWFTNTGDRPKEDIRPGNRDTSPEPQPPPKIPFHSLIELLKDELRQANRFALLETHLNSVPSNLSLDNLGICIELFDPESYKLNVIRLLKPKITDNYSDSELEAFKKFFNPYKQREAEELLPKRKR